MKTQKINSTERDELKDLVKAIYKAVHKNITLKDKKRKKDAQKVVNDILDPNYTAEADPSEIPANKPSVLMKKKKPKSVEKLKKYMSKKCGPYHKKEKKSN